MSFNQFYSTVYEKQFDSTEKVKGGSFQIQSRDAEIAHMKVGLYFKGLLTGTEQMRINVYGDSLYSALLFSSSYSVLNTASPGNWIGLVRFDFSKQSIDHNLIYYWEMETTGYTYSAIKYIAAFHDYPNPTYQLTVASTNFIAYPMKMELYGYYDKIYGEYYQCL